MQCETFRKYTEFVKRPQQQKKELCMKSYSPVDTQYTLSVPFCTVLTIERFYFLFVLSIVSLSMPRNYTPFQRL